MGVFKDYRSTVNVWFCRKMVMTFYNLAAMADNEVRVRSVLLSESVTRGRII